MSEDRDIQTEVVDPEAPVQFVRLIVDGEEKALIPWDEAEAIAKAVKYHGEEKLI